MKIQLNGFCIFLLIIVDFSFPIQILHFSFSDVFVQYCHFLLQAGFTEKTVASFQALLEFNLFFPPSLEKASHSDCIAVFESFWDSGVGRFGEPGAQGWKYWVEKKQTTLDTSCTSGKYFCLLKIISSKRNLILRNQKQKKKQFW